ncbi:MAG: O-antigen ligase family protein [Flavobacteriaceae bacterium]
MIILEKLQKILLTLSLVSVMLSIQNSSITIGLFLIVSLVIALKKRFKSTKTSIQFSFFFAGFFVLFAIGLLYTEEIAYGQKWLERNAVWALIPLLIPLSLKISYKELFRVLMGFSIVINAIGLFLLGTAILNYLETHNILVFFYDKFTSSIEFHPVYLSFYVLFSLLVLVEGLRKKYIKLHPLIILSLVLFNVVLIVLLSSKTMLASLFLVLIIFMIMNYKKQRKIVISAFLVILVSIVLITQFKETKNRINDSRLSSWELLDKETFNYNDPFTGITLRLITWKFVMKKFISEENIFVGLGTGDAENFINQVYKERNMDAGGYLNYNMHNQYLEYFLKFGLVGLIYFLGILFLSFRMAIKNKDFLYGTFLLIFSIFSLTESTLEVQKGILFFMLVNTVFFFYYLSHKKRLNE